MDSLCKVRDIYRAIMSFEAFFDKKYGVCLNEGMLLCSLQQNGSLSSGEIAGLLGLTPSNTSKIIRMAEEKALITRTLGAEDKRQMYFELSDNGKRLIKEIKQNESEIEQLLETIKR